MEKLVSQSKIMNDTERNRFSVNSSCFFSCGVPPDKIENVIGLISMKGESKRQFRETAGHKSLTRVRPFS